MKKHHSILIIFTLLMIWSNSSRAVTGGSFSASGTTLTITVVAASGTLTVSNTGSGSTTTSYTFTLSSGGWSGSETGCSASGLVLTVNSTGLAAYNTINIVNTAGVGGVGVTFGNTAYTYDDNFNVTLGNNAGTVTFNNTSFSGSNALNVTTDQGIVVSAANTLSTFNGNLTLSANMQATQNINNFIGLSIGGFVQSGNTYVKSTGSGNVSLTGRGGGSTLNGNYGVYIAGTSSYRSIVTSGGGTVTVTGTGGGSGVSSSNHGIYLRYSDITSGGNGNVSVNGTGGGGTKGYPGVHLQISSTISSGGNGSVTVTGTGMGGNNVSNTDATTGVYINSGSHITSGGSGAVVVTGYGSPVCIAPGNWGVYVGGIFAGDTASISSGGGNVTVNGTGGGSSSLSNHGVSVGQEGSSVYGIIKSGGNGNITITGTGGSNGAGNSSGVIVGGTYSNVTAYGTGSVTITGYGMGSDGTGSNRGIYNQGPVRGTGVTMTGIGSSSSSGNNNYGVYISKKVYSYGAGAVTITGTGGGNSANGANNYGIYLGNDIITTSGGNITLEGHEGAGTLSSDLAIKIDNGVVSTQTNGGMITLKANSFSLAGLIGYVVVPVTVGVLNIVPATSGVNIDLGSGTEVPGGPVAISGSELAQMGGGITNFGDVNTGTITISTAMTNNGSSLKLTTTSSAGVIPSFAGTDLTLTGQTLKFGSGTPLKISIAGTTVNTDYQQLNVDGSVDLTGASLSLIGSYIPLVGDVFTIASATALTGTFTGLSEGSTVTFNGKSLTIHYTSTAVTLQMNATEITWTGATNNDWNTASNWSSNTVPDESANVTIPLVTYMPVVTQSPATPAICNDLTITPMAFLSIDPGKALTVNGTLTNNEGTTGLLINSDEVSGSGSLIHHTADVMGFFSSTVNGSNSLTDYVYHLVSIPLSPANTSLSGIFTDEYLYDFDVANNAWNNLGNSTTTELDETRGYMVYNPTAGYINNFFEGNLNAGSFTATVVNAGQGYNLVPNPYPSSIDWDAATGWTKTNVDDATWIWNSSASTPYGVGVVGNYAAYVNGVGTNGGSRYIAPGQAFFVKTNGDSPVLSMSDDVRLHHATAFLKSDDLIPDLLRISVTANDHSDEAVVRFADEATVNLDAAFDAEKMFGLESAPQLYTLTAGNDQVAINSLPHSNEAVTVPLNFELNADKQATFTASGMENFAPTTTIYLEDKLTNTTVNLRQQGTYTFNHVQRNNAGRFLLHFNGVTGVGERRAASSELWVYDGKVYINAPEFAGEQVKVEVFNTLGQRMLDAGCWILDKGITTIPIQAIGLVIVRLTAGGKVVTCKGVVR